MNPRIPPEAAALLREAQANIAQVEGEKAELARRLAVAEARVVIPQQGAASQPRQDPPVRRPNPSPARQPESPRRDPRGGAAGAAPAAQGVSELERERRLHAQDNARNNAVIEALERRVAELQAEKEQLLAIIADAVRAPSPPVSENAEPAAAEAPPTDPPPTRRRVNIERPPL